MKQLTVLLVFCLSMLTTYAQGWEQAYPNEQSLYFSNVSGPITIPTASNGILMILDDPKVVLLDANGDSLRQESIPNQGYNRKVIKDQHGGYTLLSFASLPQADRNKIRITRLNELGQTLRTHRVNSPFSERPHDFTQTQDGGYLFTGYGNYDTNGDSDMFLIRTDSTGDTIWTYHELNENNDTGFCLDETSDGGAIVGGTATNASTNRNYIWLVKFSPTGQREWRQTYHYTTIGPPRVLETSDGNYLYASTEVSNNALDTHMVVFKADTLGNQLWKQTFAPAYSSWAKCMEPGPNGGFYLGGICYKPRPLSSLDWDFYLARIDANGNQLWNKEFGGMEREQLVDLSVYPDGSVLLSGQQEQFPFSGNSNPHAYLVRTDDLGNSFSRVIEGNVYADFGANCQLDSGDYALQNWLVRANGTIDYYDISDAAGFYQIPVDSGAYQVEVLPLGPYWGISLCAQVGLYTVMSQPYDTVVKDIPVDALIDCPYLAVSIATPFIRPCSANTYFVQYHNFGTRPAFQTHVEVTVDTFLVVDSASIPWELPQSGNVYVFELDTVAQGTGGTFRLYTSLPCNAAPLGQTHCVEAHIFPDSLCVPFDSLWDGSSVQVESRCLPTDSVELRISNIGFGQMLTPGGYTVLEDNILILQDSVQLNVGADRTFTFPGNGSTWVLQAQQSSGHPGLSFPITVIEGCGVDTSGNITLGLYNNYPHDDANPWVDVHCRENTASFDPNDKQGFPNGTGVEHYIQEGQKLTYLIRFQNTGTDTAFKVVIRDTLSPLLDPATLFSGVSSHPYRLRQYGNNLLEWIFEPIALPDSNVNEAASHGFVQFEIDPYPWVDPGAVIHNTASIYFDFNALVVTNTTWHTINEEFFVGIEEPMGTNSVVQLKLYPHPLTSSARIELPSQVASLQFEVFDLQGKLIRKVDHRHVRTFEIDRAGLPDGLYVFRIVCADGEVFNGKLKVGY